MLKKTATVVVLAGAMLLAGCTSGSSDVSEPEVLPGNTCVPANTDVGRYVKKKHKSRTATTAAAFGGFSFVGTAEARGGGGGGGHSSGGGRSSGGRSSGSRGSSRPSAGQKGYKSSSRSKGTSGRYYKAGSKKGRYYEKYDHPYSAPYIWWYLAVYHNGDANHIDQYDDDAQLVCAQNSDYDD